MMVVDNKYNIRDLVYLKTDPEQKQRMILGIMIRETHIVYDLGCGTDSSWHYDYEMTLEKDIIKTTSS